MLFINLHSVMEQAWTCGSCMTHMTWEWNCSVLGLGYSEWNGAFKIFISGLGMNVQSRSTFVVTQCVEWSIRLGNRH